VHCCLELLGSIENHIEKSSVKNILPEWLSKHVANELFEYLAFMVETEFYRN
jgi:hypothetical protein